MSLTILLLSLFILTYDFLKTERQFSQKQHFCKYDLSKLCLVCGKPQVVYSWHILLLMLWSYCHTKGWMKRWYYSLSDPATHAAQPARRQPTLIFQTVDIKSGISQPPLIGPYSNFKLKLIWPNYIYKSFKWRGPLIEEHLKILKAEYLSNYLLYHTQI